MKVAYLDGFSGISGDMFLGALLDAGLPFEELKQQLSRIPLLDYRLEMKRDERKQIFGTRFIVKVEEKNQPARNLKSIREIVQRSKLKRSVKEKSIGIFEALAKVEGRIHNHLPEEVHFHEVGGVDSIIDIIGTVYGIDRLGINELYVSPLPLGAGFVETDHGRIPIPAPATIALLEGAPVISAGIGQEMVTPTGAALVKGLAKGFGQMPPMVIQDIGYGVGKRDLDDRPNLLRLIIGETQPDNHTDMVAVLETNIDDANPEFLGHLMERLFSAGALDVVFFPVYMKKNRPGVQIQIVSRPEQRDHLMKIVFNESATLGIRFRYSERKILKRSHETVQSPWGRIKVKKVIGTDEVSFFQPEYDVCRQIAQKHHLPLREVFNWVQGLNKYK